MIWWSLGLLNGLSYLYEDRVHLYKQLGKGDTTATLSAEMDKAVVCPFSAAKVRTFDGTCNRDGHASMGAAKQRFGRLSSFNVSQLPASDEELLKPNPKVVAEKLLHRTADTGFQAEEHVNLLAAAWIQFQTHDWFTHLNDPVEQDPIKVSVEKDEIMYPEGVMNVPRTSKDPSYSDADKKAGIPQTYLNNATTWWDLSQVYGQSEEFANSRRVDGTSCKIIMDEDNMIPIDPATGTEYAGVNNNWWSGMSLMHNLFTREHNSICEMLDGKYPTMSTDEKFQKARLINMAINAKIHTVEWTPTLLQDEILYIAMNANWDGMPSFPGIVGNKMDTMVAGQTHQFPEEFTSAYRMHPMLPDEIEIKPISSAESGQQTLPLESMAFSNSTDVMKKFGLASMINSFGLGAQGKLTLQNYPKFLTAMKTPNVPGQISPDIKIDLAAIEIIRDRERGIPRYNAYRKAIGMDPITKMSDITTDPTHLDLLNEVYEGDIEQVDLLTGQLAEQTRPPGFGFSDTTFRGLFQLEGQ